MATKLKQWCLGALALALLPLPLYRSLRAQDAPVSQQSVATAATVEAKGQVRTASGVPVPGATLLLTNTAGGREWVSWTDENGQFDLPGLPAGHYRVQISQLGFDDATSEADFSSQTPTPLQLILKVATLETIEKAAQPAPAASPATTTQSAPGTSAAGPNTNGANGPTPREGQPNQYARRGGFGPGGQGGPGGAGGPGRAGGGPDGGSRRFPCGPGFPGRPGAGQGQTGGGQNAQGQGAPPENQAGDLQGGPGQGRGANQNAPAQNQQGNPCGQFAEGRGQLGGQFAGRRGQGGGFQQLQLDAGNGQPGEAASAEQQEAENEAGVGGAQAGGDQGPLGQAAASDAVLLAGTVGQGVADAGGPDGFPGGPPPDGGGPRGPGGFGGPGGPGGGGGATAFAGQGGVSAVSAGGLAGGVGGAPGLNLRVAGGGRGGRGGGPGGRPPQGVPALFGLQRVLRQRANRVRLSFYDQYGNSIFDARPFSLTQSKSPKIPTWSETTGGNLGGPLVIPHVYNGADRTFFFVNFESAWNRTAVNQFATVPTLAERSSTSPSSTTVQQLLNLIPEPNVPNAGPVDNFNLETHVPTQNTRINTRVLQTFSPKISGRVVYSFSQAGSHTFQSFPSLESNSGSRGQSVTLGLTENFNRSWINDTQLIYSRSRTLSSNSFAPIEIGSTDVWPQLTFTNFSGLSESQPSLALNQTYRFVDSVTNLRAKHTLTMGGEIRRVVNNNAYTNSAPGVEFAFSSLDSSGNPVPGADFASFLSGSPSTISIRSSQPSYLRSWAYVGYFTDDWRARPNFTLEWGVRYEAFTPPSDACGHFSNLSLSSTGGTTAATVVIPAQTSSCDTPLTTTSIPISQSSSLIHGEYDHFSPRLGIAWRPPLKAFEGKHATTIRAGYGMFYNESVYAQLAKELANQFPWACSQMVLPQAGQTLTLTSVPSSCSSTTSSVLPNTYAIDPNYTVGYAQIWNFSTETNLFTNTTLSLTYTGTKGTHLDMLFAPNRPQPGSTSLQTQVQNAGDFIYDTSSANSIFNALQVRLQQRTTHGIGFNVIYTYGKSMDDASSIGGGTPVVVQDPNNIRAEYGLSSFDVRQQLRATYFYEIPLGDRHRFAQKGIAEDLLGNWRLSSNITAQTGTPFTATETGGLGNTGGGGSFSTRPDQICNPNLPSSQRTPFLFFNTACFVAAPSGQFGDAQRNTIEGPGQFTWNLQMAKWIPFGKDQTHRVDIRWEITNLTNTPRYAGLSTVVGSATFGRVTAVQGNRTMDVNLRVNF